MNDISFIWPLVSVIIVSALSFSGALIFILRGAWLKRVTMLLVSFAVGALIGGAFFHLLPESLEAIDDPLTVFWFTFAGFALFFALERVLRWHHCHDIEHEHSHIGYLNLVGDGFHNFIDGLVIASAFAAGPAVGVPVVMSIIFHEVPQEISDFGVLLYAGFSKLKALWYNFLSALVSVVGVLIGWFVLGIYPDLLPILLAFAAGGFIYIASSDLIPELNKHRDARHAISSFVVFIAAVVFMYVIKITTE